MEAIKTNNINSVKELEQYAGNGRTNMDLRRCQVMTITAFALVCIIFDNATEEQRNTHDERSF